MTPQPWFNTTTLPSPHLCDFWDRILVPKPTKEKFLAYLDTLDLLGQRGGSPVGLSTQRAILLIGEPGCGKSSLAQGAPNVWALTRRRKAELIYINAHQLASGERGACQKNVVRLFACLEEVAAKGQTTFVIVDEAETVATNRANIHSATNPQDSIFAVNAWLQNLEAVTRKYPNLVFLFTSNFFGDLDPAFTQRMDFTLLLRPPGPEARLAIISDALSEISDLCAFAEPPAWDALNRGYGPEQWKVFVKRTEGFSPRQLRHLVVEALSCRDGGFLKIDHLLQCLAEERKQMKYHRSTGGHSLHKFNGKAKA
jgi:SpoVK/Ycf46/Vps4 family AAA+-type ATPase